MAVTGAAVGTKSRLRRKCCNVVCFPEARHNSVLKVSFMGCVCMNSVLCRHPVNNSTKKGSDPQSFLSENIFRLAVE